MSKTSMALLVKFGMTLVFAGIAFNAGGANPWFWVVVLAIVGTVLNYIAGDLMILNAFGNIVASISDGILAAFTAWALGFVSPTFQTDLGSLLTFGALIAVGEYFFHMYLKRSNKVAP